MSDQDIHDSLDSLGQTIGKFLIQYGALLNVAERIYDICDNEGDGAPDDHPHTKRLLEFAGWLQPVIRRAKGES